MKKLGTVVAALIVVSWLALLLSTHGLLVWSVGPISPKTASGQATLECTFFTGLELVTLGYYYSADGVLGRAICPRLKDFRS